MFLLHSQENDAVFLLHSQENDVVFLLHSQENYAVFLLHSQENDAVFLLHSQENDAVFLLHSQPEGGRIQGEAKRNGVKPKHLYSTPPGGMDVLKDDWSSRQQRQSDINVG